MAADQHVDSPDKVINFYSSKMVPYRPTHTNL